jgi:hypothetical protein
MDVDDLDVPEAIDPNRQGGKRVVGCVKLAQIDEVGDALGQAGKLVAVKLEDDEALELRDNLLGNR